MASNRKSSIRKKVLSIAIPTLIVIAIFAIAALRNKDKQVNIPDSTIAVGEQEHAKAPAPNAEQYSNTLITENENYELYLDGPTLSVTLKDKKTGSILETTVKADDGKNNTQWLGFMQSGVVINVIDGVNDTVQADLINNNPKIAIEEIQNGFLAYVSFPDFGLSFQMSVSLLQDSLVVEIPDETIFEDIDNYYFGAINVFPFMGYSYLGEKAGYMFIPDGNGALIYLNDKEGRLTGGFSRMIYGEDVGFKDSEVMSLLWDQLQTVNEAENIMAPIFGMVHTKEQIGFLGIVENGAERASIEAYPNGVILDYNRIYAKFLMRKIFKQPTSESNSGTITQVERDRTHYDIKLKYCLLSGEAANYTGLAVRYRNYLLEEGGLTVKDSSYHTRLDFLGTEREEWLVFKKKVVMTTVSDIRDIYIDLKEEGITDILSIYKGWQNGGLNQLPITDYKADRAIGGTSDLTKLIKEVEESGSQLYLTQDSLRTNPEENNTTFNVVKRVDKRLFEESAYMEVYNTFLYLTPGRSSFYMNRLQEAYLDKGITNISITGITNSLFSYSYSGNYYSRVDTMQDYESIISAMDEGFHLILEQPFSYLWNYTDAFLDMPVGTSNYIFADEEIPFLTIALKGVLPMYSEYMNFEANKQDFFLRLIETGIYPSFYITKEDSSNLIYTNSSDIYSSKYSIYKSEIIKYSTALKEVNDTVKNAFIINHLRLDNGVTVVSYDNGVNIYINYSDKDQTVDDYFVEAKSYKVGEAK